MTKALGINQARVVQGGIPQFKRPSTKAVAALETEEDTNCIFPEIQPDIFGPIISAADVRDAVNATIDLWGPTYVAVMAQRTGLSLQDFVSYSALYKIRGLPADQSPSYWVTMEPGSKRLQRKGSYWTAVWRAEVQVVIYGTDWDATEDLGWAYGTAVRALLLQHGGLGLPQGLVTGPLASAANINTDWVQEKYQRAQDERRRTVGVHQGQYDITVEGVLNWSAGPKVYTSSPPPGPGTQGNEPVTAVNITLEKTGEDPNLLEGQS